MKKVICLLTGIALLCSCQISGKTGIKVYSAALTKEAVCQATDDALRWQIAHYDSMNEQRRWKSDSDMSWENAIFLTAVSEWSALRHDSAMEAWYMDIAQRNRYELNATTHIYHADNLIAGMLYANIYEQTGEETVLFPTIAYLEFIKNHPQNNSLKCDNEDHKYRYKYRWSWCDALYMAPQVFARYAKLTNDESLLHFMDQEFWTSVDYLYNPEYKLFYRDSNYFDKQEANGEPVFWGRGNAWVLGGLARLMPYIPENYPTRERYVDLYKDMVDKVVSLQSEAGHWHVSMLDAESYPTAEMSSTGFFAYAIWWGLNEGILDEAHYLEPAQRAWRAMAGAMQATGMLGYVQAVGEKPEAVTREMTEVYGPAAMALSAIEILRYIDKKA